MEEEKVIKKKSKKRWIIPLSFVGGLVLTFWWDDTYLEAKIYWLNTFIFNLVHLLLIPFAIGCF
jgi:hypothetical protein